MEIVIGLIVLFVFQTVLCYGMLFGHLQGEWPTIAAKSYSRDKGMSLLCGALFGIVPVVGVFIAFCVTGCAVYGFKFK